MQAIFFDAHGVLYTRQDRDRRLRAFLEQHGLSLDAPVSARLAAQETRERAFRGLIERDVLFDALLAAYGVTDALVLAAGRRAQAADAATITLYEGVTDTLWELKARGYKLGVVTDSAASSAEKQRWFRAQGLSIAWDAFANSSEVGVRKPEPQIYQVALEQAGVAPSETVFVGHAAHELAGARALGLTTVAFNPDAGAHADDTINHFTELLELFRAAQSPVAFDGGGSR